jgi:RNA polymerase sigma-70 factor (ECF subfamily)
VRRERPPPDDEAVTGSAPSRHSEDVPAAAAQALPMARPTRHEKALGFDGLWEANVDFVWHLLRRLGVNPGGIDDAVQDVFLIIHRKLASFQGRSSVRTWISGIAVGVAANARRKQHTVAAVPLDEEMADARTGPHERVAKAEAAAILDRLLGEIDDDQREVLVLVEVQQMSAPEIAEALGVNVNTVYSRLRLGRQKFEAALARYKGEAP